MTKKEKLKNKALDYLKTTISSNTELIESHRDGFDAYMGKPYGNELEGRSQVVMSDVADTIEWIMPSLMKVFFGGTTVAELTPQGPEDELPAKLMQEKINFDVQKGMNGYLILHDWFKDALLGKYGVTKYWWETDEKRKPEDYEGLNQAEYDTLIQEEDYEVDKVEEIIVQEAIEDELVFYPAVVSYNVSGFRVKKISKPMAKVVPPGEFIFDIETNSTISESEFCAHKRRVHKNYLSKYNISEHEADQQIETFKAEDLVKDARFEDLGGQNFVIDENDEDFVYIYECYMNDYSKKGDKIPMKVVIYGDMVLEAEENTYGAPPFCGLTTVRIPHRAAGLSMAEMVADLQKLKTALMRAILDNIYYQNNGIDIVNPYRINMDDVIDRNEPGAKWRTLYDVDPNTVFASKNPTPLSQQTFQLLETVEEIKEKRTGVTSYNQGLDSKSLNKTATGISQIMGAAQQRMELIARTFAETGVKDLFQAFVDMNLEYFDSEVNVRINDEWQTINPEALDGEFDLSIDVGVGTGSQEVQVSQLINMINVSSPGMQMGVVTKQNFYNILKSIYEKMGYKNAEKFVTNPSEGEGQNQEVEQLKTQFTEVLEEAKGKIDKLEYELREAKSKREIDAAKLKLQERSDRWDYEVDLAKIAQDERDSIRDSVTNVAAQRNSY